MPLDEATRRFSFLLQRDLRKLAESEETRASRGEALKYDSVSRLAVYETRRGDVVTRLYGEMLASYSSEDRILRWAWAGRSTSTSVTHGDAIFREGQARGIPQLSMSLVGELDIEEAVALARLGALVARAEALHVRHVGKDVQYIGLFERPRPSEQAAEARISVPPPPPAPARETPAAPPRAYRSLPPIREIWEPRTGGSRPPASSSSAPPPVAVPPAPRVPRTSLREPAREIFLPVANAALGALARKCAGYKQGLFVITVDEESSREKRRLIVQLVAVDAQGLLVALDPPAESRRGHRGDDRRRPPGRKRAMAQAVRADHAEARRRRDAQRRRALSAVRV
ncbi:MAG: hypothetical protein QM702_20890 [Rubrivivax sp.]